MPAQNREAKRNYIDLVSDESEPLGSIDTAPWPPRILRDYLLGLIAGVLRTRRVTR